MSTVHNTNTSVVPSMVSSMSLSDKIGQMSQIDIHLILNPDNSINYPQIEFFFGKLGIGSLLITPFSPNSYFPISKYRSIISAIQNVTQTSSSRNKPPVLIGIDSVHGANYIQNAIMTPQQINLASTFNTTNAYLAGVMASKDTRSAGITWIFSPILGLGIESLWSRMYETFGEDPHLVGEMGKAIVKGIQTYNDDNDDDDQKIIPSRSAACAKHFIGYSAPRTGHDRSPSWIPKRHLHQYFVKPWKEVLSLDTKKNNNEKDDNNNSNPINFEKAYTVMESYTEYNGIPNVANQESLHTILRQDLEFDGVLITDYQEVENLISWHHTARDITEAVKMTLVEGSVDINMIPFNFDGWKENVYKSMAIDPANPNSSSSSSLQKEERNVYAPFPSNVDRVSMERIDESVTRILQLKETLNLFEEVIEIDDNKLNGIVGTEQDRNVALDMARESIILTKNEDNTLPTTIQQSSSSTTGLVKVHVTGPTSNSLRYQSGGWTIQWQGSLDESSFTYGETVLDAAKNVKSWDVSFSCGVDILGNECEGDQQNNTDLHMVSDSDYVIICIGEEAYTEKPGDIRQLELPRGQIEFVQQIKKATNTGKLVLVYFGGRPRLLKEMVDTTDAILIAFLPGPDGGRAVIDILTGEYNPSARLPITYPKHADKGGVPYWHAVSDRCTKSDDHNPLPHYEYTKCEVEWPFGHGLSYTKFVHADLALSKTRLVMERSKGFVDTIDISLIIQNVGGRSGSEAVMIFLFVENRHVTPEEKILWYFEKIELDDGEEKRITSQLSTDDLRYVGPHDHKHLILQPGMKLKLGVGPYVDCRNQNTALCSDTITIDVKDNELYSSSCEFACNLWQESTCNDFHNFSFDSCWDECLSSKSLNVNDSSGW